MSARPDLSAVDRIAAALKLPDGLVHIVTAIDVDEAEELRETLDARTAIIQQRIKAASAGEAHVRNYWQRRKLVHDTLTIKLLAALAKAGLK